MLECLFEYVQLFSAYVRINFTIYRLANYSNYHEVVRAVRSVPYIVGQSCAYLSIL